VPLSVGGGAGSPSNALSPGPRPTSVPSGISVHPTVWPQNTNVTDRQNRQLSDSSGRTVTCNGRLKTNRFKNSFGTQDSEEISHQNIINLSASLAKCNHCTLRNS